MDSNPQIQQATAGVKLVSFKIETDGTNEKTKVLLNGKEIANLSSVYFSFWPSSSYRHGVDISYTVRDPNVKDGELAAYTSYNYRPCTVSPCVANTNAAGEKVMASVAGLIPPIEMTLSIASHRFDPLNPDSNKERQNLYAKLK